MTLVTVARGCAPDKENLAERLESGAILLFPDCGLMPAPGHLEVLRRQNPPHSRFHKISYRSETGRLGGVSEIPREERERVRAGIAEFSRHAQEFVAALFPRYATSWRVGYTSFRPYEEEGRPLRTRSRNDLMHVDAFPTRPTNGDRILRVFTNIHPSKPRVWVSGGGLEDLAGRFAFSAGILSGVARRGRSPFHRVLRAVGLRRDRSPYDEFMLRFHDYLKENDEFQKTGRREEFSFAPGSTWMVFTDSVSHAVLSGRHALEQTFLISRASLSSPESAPIAILERLAGRPMSRQRMARKPAPGRSPFSGSKANEEEARRRRKEDMRRPGGEQRR